MSENFDFGENSETTDGVRAQLQYPLDVNSKGIIKTFVKEVSPELNRIQSITLKSGDTSFDVRASDNMSVSSSATVSISSITNGYNGQLLNLIFNDSNVTLVHSASGNRNTLNLNGANIVSVPNTTLQLVNNGTYWQIVTDIVNQATFGGNGSDGAISISSGTTTVNLAGAKLVIKNYTSLSITGTGKLAFSNPHASGTLVVLKSKGDVILTSSATPMVDLVGMGADGGASSVSGGAGVSGLPGTASTITALLCGAGTGAVVGVSNGVGGAAAVFQIQSTIFEQSFKYPVSFIGAGGGSGDATGAGSASGAGGKGGGALVIECGGALNFTTASGISVGGAVGSNGTGTTAGGGGGGGSGSAVILYNSLTAASGTITSSGGVGGNGVSSGTTQRGGGGGGSREAGDNGTSNTINAKTGGDGGDGVSLIAQNTVFR